MTSLLGENKKKNEKIKELENQIKNLKNNTYWMKKQLLNFN